MDFFEPLSKWLAAQQRVQIFNRQNTPHDVEAQEKDREKISSGGQLSPQKFITGGMSSEAPGSSSPATDSLARLILSLSSGERTALPAGSFCSGEEAADSGQPFDATVS